MTSNQWLLWLIRNLFHVTISNSDGVMDSITVTATRHLGDRELTISRQVSFLEMRYAKQDSLSMELRIMVDNIQEMMRRNNILYLE